MQLRSIVLLCGLLLTGCDTEKTETGQSTSAAEQETGQPDTEEDGECDTGAETALPDTNAACESCIADGGTWQPEAEACTVDCAIQDISCFTDSCPGACNGCTCQCFSGAECEAVGCTWNMVGEAAWCN